MILRNSKNKSLRAGSIVFSFGKENTKKSIFMKSASKLSKMFETIVALKYFTPFNTQSVIE